MNAFYKVKGDPYWDDGKDKCGVVVGKDEADIMRKVANCYKDMLVEVTFWFGENYTDDIIELNDFNECPLFDNELKS